MDEEEQIDEGGYPNRPHQAEPESSRHQEPAPWPLVSHGGPQDMSPWPMEAAGHQDCDYRSQEEIARQRNQAQWLLAQGGQRTGQSYSGETRQDWQVAERASQAEYQNWPLKQEDDHTSFQTQQGEPGDRQDCSYQSQAESGRHQDQACLVEELQQEAYTDTNPELQQETFSETAPQQYQPRPSQGGPYHGETQGQVETQESRGRAEPQGGHTSSPVILPPRKSYLSRESEITLGETYIVKEAPPETQPFTSLTFSPRGESSEQQGIAGQLHVPEGETMSAGEDGQEDEEAEGDEEEGEEEGEQTSEQRHSSGQKDISARQQQEEVGDLLLSCTLEGCDFTTQTRFVFKEHVRKLHNGKLYGCLKCSLLFSTREALKAHKPQHKPFRCPHCGFACSLQDKYRRHLLGHDGKLPQEDDGEELQQVEADSQVHDGKQVERDGQATSPADLSQHRKDAHSQARLQCEECPYSTPYHKKMEVHRHVHSGKKQSISNMLKHTAQQKSNLQSSTQRKHPDVDGQPITSQQKPARQSDPLQRHLAKHPEYPSLQEQDLGQSEDSCEIEEINQDEVAMATGSGVSEAGPLEGDDSSGQEEEGAYPPPQNSGSSFQPPMPKAATERQDYSIASKGGDTEDGNSTQMTKIKADIEQQEELSRQNLPTSDPNTGQLDSALIAQSMCNLFADTSRGLLSTQQPSTEPTQQRTFQSQVVNVSVEREADRRSTEPFQQVSSQYGGPGGTQKDVPRSPTSQTLTFKQPSSQKAVQDALQFQPLEAEGDAEEKPSQGGEGPVTTTLSTFEYSVGSLSPVTPPDMNIDGTAQNEFGSTQVQLTAGGSPGQTEPENIVDDSRTPLDVQMKSSGSGESEMQAGPIGVKEEEGDHDNDVEYVSESESEVEGESEDLLTKRLLTKHLLAEDAPEEGEKTIQMNLRKKERRRYQLLDSGDDDDEEDEDYQEDEELRPVKRRKYTPRRSTEPSVSYRAKLQCEHCDFTCKQERALETHLRKYHRIKVPLSISTAAARKKPAPKPAPKGRKRPYVHKKILKCSQCDFTCYQDRALQTHLRSHTGEKPFKCEECDFQSAQKYKLTEHMAVHDESRQFKCGECGQGFTSQNHLQQHELRHTGQPTHSCDLCEYGCYDQASLNRHIKNMHSGDLEFICPTCDGRFNSQAHLNRHMTMHRGKRDPEDLKCPHDGCSFMGNSRYGLWKHNTDEHKAKVCLKCSEEFDTYEQLKEHKKVHKTHKCDRCNFSTSSENYLQKHILDLHGDGDEISCDQCEFTCGHELILKKHQNAEHRQPKPEKLFQCQLCDFSQTKRCLLARHMRRVHSTATPYKCDKCNYSAKEVSQLHVHQRVHEDERRYLCSECGYTCKWANQLKIHQMSHTGEKPFTCPYCSYACERSDKLKIHVRTHTKEKPYMCEQCGFRCSTKSSLRSHSRKHRSDKPYQCQLCDSCFKYPTGLYLHMKTHKEDKPFKCEHCSYSTPFKRCLQQHMLQHTGERPFKCQYCLYTATQKGNFQAHMQKKHPWVTTTSSAEATQEGAVPVQQPDQGEGSLQNKRYKCHLCSYSIDKKQRLDRHIEKHLRGIIQTPGHDGCPVTMASILEPEGEALATLSTVSSMRSRVSIGRRQRVSNKDKAARQDVKEAVSASQSQQELIQVESSAFTASPDNVTPRRELLQMATPQSIDLSVLRNEALRTEVLRDQGYVERERTPLQMTNQEQLQMTSRQEYVLPSHTMSMDRTVPLSQIQSRSLPKPGPRVSTVDSRGQEMDQPALQTLTNMETVHIPTTSQAMVHDQAGNPMQQYSTIDQYSIPMLMGFMPAVSNPGGFSQTPMGTPGFHNRQQY